MGSFLAEVKEYSDPTKLYLLNFSEGSYVFSLNSSSVSPKDRRRPQEIWVPRRFTVSLEVPLTLNMNLTEVASLSEGDCRRNKDDNWGM